MHSFINSSKLFSLYLGSSILGIAPILFKAYMHINASGVEGIQTATTSPFFTPNFKKLALALSICLKKSAYVILLP